MEEPDIYPSCPRYQIVAMMFLKVESIVKSANNNVGIADAVVGIPGWFTDAQRRAVLVRC